MAETADGSLIMKLTPVYDERQPFIKEGELDLTLPKKELAIKWVYDDYTATGGYGSTVSTIYVASGTSTVCGSDSEHLTYATTCTCPLITSGTPPSEYEDDDKDVHMRIPEVYYFGT